jgi:hypothetical protein
VAGQGEAVVSLGGEADDVLGHGPLGVVCGPFSAGLSLAP